jgi:hypothetical protein
MKRCVVFVVIFATLLGAVHGQSIDKTQYKAAGIQEYLAAGTVKERTDTELFRLDVTFMLQAANSVAVQDADGVMRRFASEKKLEFKRGAKIVLYISSTHSAEGGWETEIIDLAEPRAKP